MALSQAQNRVLVAVPSCFDEVRLLGGEDGCSSGGHSQKWVACGDFDGLILNQALSQGEKNNFGSTRRNSGCLQLEMVG